MTLFYHACSCHVPPTSQGVGRGVGWGSYNRGGCNPVFREAGKGWDNTSSVYEGTAAILSYIIAKVIPASKQRFSSVKGQVCYCVLVAWISVFQCFCVFIKMPFGILTTTLLGGPSSHPH